MPIRPRYKLFSSCDNEHGRLEIEDLRGIREDGSGYVDLSAYLEGGDDEDGSVMLRLDTENVVELRAILDEIIGREAEGARPQ